MRGENDIIHIQLTDLVLLEHIYKHPENKYIYRQLNYNIHGPLSESILSHRYQLLLKAEKHNRKYLYFYET